ncbi:hypothetical protein DFH06DRAFT_1132412 [Mycena polygramma]|nr:hypothetical protein DFH06DRAFT_1132412 [Mycena polygramma]
MRAVILRVLVAALAAAAVVIPLDEQPVIARAPSAQIANVAAALEIRGEDTAPPWRRELPTPIADTAPPWRRAAPTPPPWRRQADTAGAETAPEWRRAAPTPPPW